MANASKSWREQIPGAFAFQLAPFAGHPLDERRAVKMFHAALRAGATEKQILEAVSSYLESQGCDSAAIERQLKRVRQFKPRPTKKICSSRAWLVTLESTSQPRKVVSIFRAQRGAEFVRTYMEQYYIDTYYSPHEKLLYARSRKHNPYPAIYEAINGVRWQGRITCGHNPYLYGRLVRNLQVARLGGVEEFLWEEIPIPQRILDE